MYMCTAILENQKLRNSRREEQENELSKKAEQEEAKKHD